MISLGKATIAGFVALASIFTIVALATEFWMEGCFDIGQYLHVLQTLTFHAFNDTEAAEIYEGALSHIKGPMTCFSSGLFRFHIESSNFTRAFPHDEVLIFLHATSALLIISLVIGAVGAILCVIGSHLDPRGSSGRTKFMGGMIAIAFGAICLFVGMVVFTVLMKPATEDHPMLFFNQFSRAVMNLRRHRRSFIDLEDLLFQLEEEAVVRFAYSFYLGWMSCLVMFLVTAFNCVILCRKKHEDVSNIILK